jgi:hypothetical protein
MPGGPTAVGARRWATSDQARASFPDYPSQVPTDGSIPGARYTPPDLPPVKANLFHIVLPLTALWFVALLVLLFQISGLREHHHLLWLWTAAAGTFLGGLGLSIYAWQRSAARRGHRSAQQMALDEQI